MNKLFATKLGLLVLLAVNACGPSQAELDATATLITANIYATLTAQAPTDTPTFTPTPTFTNTPTFTATSTPSPSPTPTKTPTATRTNTPTPQPPTSTPRPPTFTPQPPTKTPKASGGKTIKITIQNDTGGTMSLTLVGPQTYNFTFPSGKHTINIVQGKYTFTAYGCGGASDSGERNMKAGTEWRFYCR